METRRPSGAAPSAGRGDARRVRDLHDRRRPGRHQPVRDGVDAAFGQVEDRDRQVAGTRLAGEEQQVTPPAVGAIGKRDSPRSPGTRRTPSPRLPRQKAPVRSMSATQQKMFPIRLCPSLRRNPDACPSPVAAPRQDARVRPQGNVRRGRAAAGRRAGPFRRAGHTRPRAGAAARRPRLHRAEVAQRSRQPGRYPVVAEVAPARGRRGQAGGPHPAIGQPGRRAWRRAIARRQSQGTAARLIARAPCAAASPAA